MALGIWYLFRHTTKDTVQEKNRLDFQRRVP